MNSSTYIYVERREAGRWTYVLPPGAPPVEFGWSASQPMDWLGEAWRYHRDLQHVLFAGAYNLDNFPSVTTEWRNRPDAISPEAVEALTHTNEGCSWILLSELKRYDFDQKALMVVRRSTSEQIAADGRKGTPGEIVDIQSHRWKAWQEAGYEESLVPVRDCVPDLIALIELIERSCAGTPDEDVRLLFWFEY